MRSKTQRGNWIGLALAALVLAVVAAPSAQGQTYSVLYNFCPGTPSCVDGDEPYGGLVQATNGDLYGTTADASLPPGDNGYGNVFKITPGGTETNLYSFDPDNGDGAYPEAGLVQATNGNLYGTTYMAGPYSYGTVFQITPGGVFGTLYDFGLPGSATNGAYPTGNLIQATDGNLYGTTQAGGANWPQYSNGTVFRISPGGAFSPVYSFCGEQPPPVNCTEGSAPYAGLVQATNGDFYGTTLSGGTNIDCDESGCGTIFKVTPAGVMTTLYSFCALSNCADGSYPYAGLVQAANGDLYGTTESGGTGGGGTAFKITPGGTFTLLYTFCSKTSCSDGGGPVGTLVQGTDGNLYGTGGGGGAHGMGIIFKITPSSGTLTTLYSFGSEENDGSDPTGTLIQDTNGNFYGTTKLGGTNGSGIVFKLSMGLKSFVETNPTSGKVGLAVKILGTKLTGATSVTFNGKAAKFKVVSGSEITTTVPTGATTGKVKVKTPSGTLTSNVNFRVP